MPELPAEPIEPHIEESAGKHSQMATFQDLLRTDADADIFEQLATTVPMRVDPVSGRSDDAGSGGPVLLPGRFARRAAPAGLPAAAAVLLPGAVRLLRPDCRGLGQDGGLERVVADLPVSDEVPRQGVPTGPRLVSFEESGPASLVWIEALDGGDPKAEAEHRDRLMRLAAPFTAEPAQAGLVQHRCLGWYDMAAAGEVLMTEHDRDRRWLTTRLTDLAVPEPGRVIFDHSADEAYQDPGSPLVTVHAGRHPHRAAGRRRHLPARRRRAARRATGRSWTG